MLKILFLCSHKTSQYAQNIDTLFSNIDISIETSYDEDEFDPYVIEKIKNSSLIFAFAEIENADLFLKIGYAIGLGKKIVIFDDVNRVFPFQTKNLYVYNDMCSSNFIIDRILENIKKSISKVDNDFNYDDIINEIKYNHDYDILNSLSPKEFEDFVFEHFKRMGYNPESSNSRYEFGYDIVLHNYKNYGKTLVEVKKINDNSRNISISVIQQLTGALHENYADCGIVVTNTNFSGVITNYVKNCSKTIELWSIREILNTII